MGDRTPIYQCDSHFFDVIDSEAKAYWLGFIAADGSIQTDDNDPTRGPRYRLVVNLSRIDVEHLHLLRTSLSASHPVVMRGAGCSSFVVNAKTLVAALMRHGIHPKKSLTLEWPSTIPDDLLRHYVRGYIDGDGSYLLTQRSAYQSGGVHVLGTPEFVDCLNRWMRDNAGVRLQTTRPNHENPRNVSVVWTGNHQFVRIANLLYADATVYLARKKDKVDEIRRICLGSRRQKRPWDHEYSDELQYGVSNRPAKMKLHKQLLAPELMQRIDDVRSKTGLSRSEWIRRAILKAVADADNQ